MTAGEGLANRIVEDGEDWELMRDGGDGALEHWVSIQIACLNYPCFPFPTAIFPLTLSTVRDLENLLKKGG